MEHESVINTGTNDKKPETKDDGTENKETEKKTLKVRSPWNIYYKEVRPLLQKEFPEASFKELSTIAAAKYKELTPEEREIYEKKSQETKQLVKTNKLAEPTLSKAEKDKKELRSPYFIFMTRKHEELRKTDPEMTYKQRYAKIMEEWTKLSMIEKAQFTERNNESTQQQNSNGQNNIEPDPTDIIDQEMKLPSEDESEDQKESKEEKSEQQSNEIEQQINGNEQQAN